MTQAGEPCPNFSLQAAVSERTVDTASLADKRAVLVVHGPKTVDAPKTVGKAVRRAFPSADDVFVANIVDLRKMGGIWQKLANAQMKATYEKMTSKLEGTVDDPAKYVVICPDWDGEACIALGVPEPDLEAQMLVLDNGAIVAVCSTAEDVVAALNDEH